MGTPSENKMVRDIGKRFFVLALGKLLAIFV
jgi:hypothetical protein